MVMTTASSSEIKAMRSVRGKRRLLSGACSAALVLAGLFPSVAWADDYDVSTATELFNAITTANANGDPSATIRLTANIALTTLPQLAKPITIDTQGFTLSGIITAHTNGQMLTIVGTVRGADGVPAPGAVAGADGLLINTTTALSAVTNNGSIRGGDTSQALARAGDGVEVVSTALINNNMIAGGDVSGGGSAAVGVTLRRGSTLTNYGTVRGGNNASGPGGYGVDMGGPGALNTLINHGTILGGSGTVDGGGVVVRSGSAPIVNTGTIQGGTGAMAIVVNSPSFNLVVTNSGTIQAGAGADAIAWSTGFPPTTGSLTLELQAGSTIIGNVVAGTVPTNDTLRLGGSDDYSFDASALGTQYQNFDIFEKTGTSTWTFTGDGTAATNWTVQQGTLQFGDGGTAGSINGNVTLNNDGVLAFDHSNFFTYGGLISGTGSVLQKGGVVELAAANTYSGGTTIGGGGTLQITSDANLGDAAGGVTFDDGTLRILSPIVTGRNFTLAGNGTLNVDTTFVTATALTIGGDITGPGTLTKDGLGRLTITGDATNIGSITVSRGTLQVGNGGTSGSIAGNIVVDAGTGVVFNRSDSYAYDGSISGAGSVSVDAGILTLTGDSSMSGSLTAQVGTGLRIMNGNTVSTTALANVNGATLTVSGIGSTLTAQRVQTSTLAAAANITVENGGTIRTTTGPLALAPSIGAGAATLNITGAGSLVDAATGLTAANGTSTTTTANITISAGGTLRSGVLNTIGSLNGNTTASTVTITGTGSNWTSTGTLLMRNGQFSVLGGGGASFDTAQIGTIAQGAGALVSGAGSTFTTAQALVIGSTTGKGALTIADGGRVSTGAGLTLAADAGTTGVVNIGGVEGGPAAGAGFIDGAVIFGPGTGRLNFNHTDTGYAFASLISGAGTVNQVSGTTVLTADNSYTGATTISGGTLRINGDQSAATGLVSVLSGGTLGGSGIIGGNVDVADGGTIAPGNSPGTLTINGDLTLASGSQLAFELGQAGTPGGTLNDLIDVGGNLTLDGTVNVSQSAGGDFSFGIYRLFNYGGALTDNGLAVGTLPAGAEAFVQTSVAGQVNLVNIGGLDLNFWDGAAGPKFNSVIDGGSGVWQAHTGNDNWTDASGAINAGYSDGAVAIFTGTAGTVTVDDNLGAVTASGMQFATGGYVISGDALTLIGPQATIRVGDGTAAGAGYTATILSELTGTSQLVKTDLGTLALLGDNSYTGGTRIDGGILRLGNGGATGSIIGDIVDNGTLVVNRTGTVTLDGMISGTGSLTQLGGGVLVLSGTNSYSGGTLIGGSTVRVSSDANLGDVAGTLSLQGGALQAGASFTSNRTILLGGASSNRIDVQGFDVTLAGPIGNGPNNSAGNFLDKLGSGTLTLTGANSYANRTVIAAGTLALAGAGTAGAGNLIIGGGTVFDISQTNIGARVIQLNSGPAGTIALGSKTLTLGASNSFSDWSGTIADGGIAGGTGGRVVISAFGGAVRFYQANSYTGGTTVSSGTFVLGGNGSLYSGGAVAVNGGAVFDISSLTATGTTIGDLSGAGALSLGGKSLTFGTGNSTSYTGAITGTGGTLVKTGTGTFALFGANSYTGATNVTAGTLLVNGNQSAATGLTTVSAGATLGGSGTIGGDVVVADGATLSPGNSPGTLTINGNLSLSGGSALAYELGARNAVGSPLNDLVNVGGNLVLDGTINVAASAGGSFDIGLYRIFDYGGTLTDNGLAVGTMPAGAELTVQTSVAGQVNLVNTGSAVLNYWDGGATANKFNNLIDGGGGTWFVGAGEAWTDVTGAVNAPYDNGSFAVFAGTGSTVNIDNSLGTVIASGLQFASNGYRFIGGALTLTGPQSTIRVGDGSPAGGGMTATIDAELTGNTQLVKTDLGRLVLNGANSYTGGTAINGGTLQIASDANLGAATGGLSFNGGTLNTTADIASARAIDFAGQAVFSTNAGTTLTLTGTITGAGNLGKTNTGTLVLAGTGSYTGGTTVIQGTLLVNGNYAAATGLTSIGGSGTLGGAGTIGGDVNLAPGATLAPGAGGAGTLTINGDLTLATGSQLAYEFGQANTVGGALNDLVNVGGDLTLDGTIDVAVPAGGAFGAGIYRVFNYGGALTNNGLTLGALPAGSNVSVQTSIAGQINLVNSAGLSLSFWDGAAGPKNNGAINGGTGVWQNGNATDNWTDASGAINAAYSNGAFAVFAGTGGTVTVDNGAGQVTAAGMQFATGGYTLAGGGIALTGPQSTIRVGDGNPAGAGYTATINAALSGDTQLVKSDAGTLVLGGTNSYTGGTLITGGTVQIASDANLGAAAGGVTLDGGTLATSATLASARSFTLAGTGGMSIANGSTLTLSGPLSGTGALTKTGGTLLLTGNGSAYTGALTVASGTLVVQGTLGGAATIAAGARLEGTGQLGSVTNNGVVAPGGDALGTLTLTGSYAGNGGTIEIAAALGGDASPTDRLVVNGDTSGAGEIVLANRGGLGAQTIEGIKVIDVGGASNGVFTLRGDYQFAGSPAVIAGAYGYRLYKGGVATPADGDWYLRSALLPNTGPQLPLYQPGVPVYEAYGQALLAMNAIGTMQERIGNRQWAARESGEPTAIWGRMESGRTRPNAQVSTSLADSDMDSWKLELGADRVIGERSDGATLVLGLLGGYGEAKTNVRSPYGNGRIKTRGYSAGATLSWFGPQGFYVDGRAQLNWYDSDLTSATLGRLAKGNDGKGESYSVEVGKRSSVGGHLSLTPQIQTVYSTVRFDGFTDPNDAVVSSHLGDSFKTRGGISIDWQDENSHLYGIVNFSYEWLDGTIADVSGTPIARSNYRLWSELGLGGTVKIADRLTLYSQVSANTAVQDFGDSYTLKGVGGLRLAF